MPSILLVDDEPDILEFLEQYLQDMGMDVSTTTSAQDALQQLRKKSFDMVISDIRMPEMSGVELLKTAHASLETAIDAQQHGAYGYLTKPFKSKEEVRQLVLKALEKRTYKAEQAPKRHTDAQQSQVLFQALHKNQIVGRSQKMLEVCHAIGTVAATDSTVLINGESGTGKELVARAIHEASPRQAGPFVSINCGAFPETLLESELFGEIGETTLPMQVKLLRVLQERKFRPLGGTAEVAVDVRVIAATNRDLKGAIHQGQFRDDLYYRIAVITIELPALRERAEDIELLALHFLRQYAERARKNISSISPEALRCLQSYSWPGNIRELENSIERAVALETTEVIEFDRLPEVVRNPHAFVPRERAETPDGPFDLEAYLRTVEKDLICKALEHTDGNQTLAAEYLKLTKPSLRHRIQTLGIDPIRFKRSTAAS